MKTILPQTLVPMDIFAGDAPLRVRVDYARTDNLLFGERIYRKDARLWLHEDLAKVVVAAARLCYETHNMYFVLHDGLRTVEAQQRMLETRRVRENPRWLEEPRLLSPPGMGAHPRGMAIDISLETPDGQVLDMGTPFDYLCEDGSGPDVNPAHRAYKHEAAIAKNRAMLDDAMMKAAEALGVELLLLPQEWWDFRLTPEVYNTYAPLSDSALPADMRMTDPDSERL